MSKRSPTVILQDILESIEKIGRYTESLDYEDFISSSIVIDAVVRNIEIIGELPRTCRMKSNQNPDKSLGKKWQESGTELCTNISESMSQSFGLLFIMSSAV